MSRRMQQDESFDPLDRSIHLNTLEWSRKLTNEQRLKRRRDQNRHAQQRCRRNKKLKRTSTNSTSNVYAETTDVQSVMDAVKRCDETENKADWWEVLKSVLLRVQTTIRYVSNEYPHLAVLGSQDHRNEEISPDEEIGREFTVQIHDAATKQWMDLFVVKPSTIPNAGFGLFAARKYQPLAVLGKYVGKVLQFDEEIPSEYAMRIGTSNLMIDQEPLSPERSQQRLPLFFGFHLLNDCCLKKEKGDSNRRVINTRSNKFHHNVQVTEELTVVAIAPIEEGDELFLDYNYEG